MLDDFLDLKQWQFRYKYSAGVRVMQEHFSSTEINACVGVWLKGNFSVYYLYISLLYN